MRPATLLTTACTLAALVPACNLSQPSAREESTTRASAVTAAARASLPPRSAWNDIGPRPGTPPPQQIPRPALVPASEHPAHFRKKVVDKPPLASRGAPPPVPAAYIAKQNEYLRQWGELEPTISDLPPEARDGRRAALKRQVLGD
jgi:hypothetical protein